MEGNTTKTPVYKPHPVYKAIKNIMDEAPKEGPKEGPKETPKEGPKEGPKETPKETPKEAPKEGPKEGPKEAPKETLHELTESIENIKTELEEKESTDTPQTEAEKIISVENWSGPNLETLSQWIQISSLQIEVLDLAIKYFRSIVRRNVLLGLIFSTASGSISISQINSSTQREFLNIIFTIMSFSIAIFTGLIKIYQVQERLEEFIQLKQEWIGFSVVITTEIQLPVKERKKALDLITKNKNKYLDLLKRDVDIPNYIKGRAYKNLYHDKQHYLKNVERFRKLKEIWACADETYFLKAADALEKDETILFDSGKKECTWDTCFCFLFDRFVEFSISFFRFFFTNKDKYIGEKTALSNIILTVIMEEENQHRNIQILNLLNLIRERKTTLYRKIEEYQTTSSYKKKYADSLENIV